MPSEQPPQWVKVLGYLIGEATGPNGEALHVLPYRVHYTPGYEGGDFCLSSGDGHNGNASFLCATQVLEPQWRADLEAAGALWLVPLLSRVAEGEEVAPSEIFGAYKKLHGRKPRREEWHVLRGRAR